jgi:large subunit ribosomal protein L32e
MSVDTPNFRGHFPLTTRRRKKRRDVNKWRKPQGIDRSISEKRGPRPKVGYGHKNTEKNKHPCGLKEILIRSKTDLLKVDENNVAIRFSSTIGQKKKIELVEIAKQKKLKILN